jgi:hypothetical protein
MTDRDYCTATLSNGASHGYRCDRDAGHHTGEYWYDTEHCSDATDDHGIEYVVTWQGPVAEDEES